MSVSPSAVRPPSSKSMMLRLLAITGLVLLMVVSPTFVRSSSSPQPRRTVDLQLTGQQADDYFAQKAAHDPEFARFLAETEKAFRAKGWTKPAGANMALIRRVERPKQGFVSKLVTYITGGVRAEEMGTSTGGGEILMSAWDDGNWNTYEGAIWVKDYNIGDTFWFEHNFDYSASQDEWTLPTVLYTGPVSWRDREGRERPGRQGRFADPAHGFIAKVSEAVCPTLGAQASDHLSCSANPRSLVNAFMKQGFIRLRENAGWLLGGAAAGGIAGGPAGFFGGLTLQGAGIILDGYVGEFNRWAGRCGGV